MSLDIALSRKMESRNTLHFVVLPPLLGMDFMEMLPRRVRSFVGWVLCAMIMLEQWFFLSTSLLICGIVHMTPHCHRKCTSPLVGICAVRSNQTVQTKFRTVSFKN